jgi:hypothetical protein
MMSFRAVERTAVVAGLMQGANDEVAESEDGLPANSIAAS